MDSVVLYAFRSPEIKISIEACFKENGDLVIDGFDIGKTVENYFGDSDYEYILTVPAVEIEKLFPLLGSGLNDKTVLLSQMQTKFNTNTCFSDIQKFLTDHGVQHSTFTWR